MLAEKLPSKTSRNMLKQLLNETLAASRSDFAGSDELRRMRVDSISKIIFSMLAHGKLDEEIQTVLPILRELGLNLANLTPLASAFAPFRRRGDYRMHFYGMCYHYALFVEGVFDESIRLLFLLISSSEGEHIPLEKINRLTLPELREKFKGLNVPDVFFQGWENRVRNSIAHARFRYDEKQRKMHFVDIDLRGKLPDYSGWFTLEQFGRLEIQLSDVYQIIQDVILLVRVQQLMLAPFVPEVGKMLIMPGIRKAVADGLLDDR